jgi:hypothetical protein
MGTMAVKASLAIARIAGSALRIGLIDRAPAALASHIGFIVARITNVTPIGGFLRVLVGNPFAAISTLSPITINAILAQQIAVNVLALRNPHTALGTLD